MNDTMKIAFGLLLPLLGTIFGSAMVFFLSAMSSVLQKLLLGFASGVMIAAAVWSLLIPAIEMAQQGNTPSWIPALIGFLLGVGFLLTLDTIIPHLHVNSNNPEGSKTSLGKSTMLVLAVTLHNIPEGMAVGVVFAGIITGTSSIPIAAALALSIGITIQNFPEGAIVSMPLLATGMSKRRAFSYGILSGIVEPLSAVLTILLTTLIMPILPYILSFAAGAMIYVVIEELIPQSQAGSHSNVGTIGAAIGFALMMVLDVALS